MATSLTSYQFRPSELRRIMNGQVGHFDTDLELIGVQVAKKIKRNINSPYPPVGTRPYPARRTGKLYNSITPVVSFHRSALAGVVMADVDHAWYATRLRNDLGYDIVTQGDIDSIKLGRRR